MTKHMLPKLTCLNLPWPTDWTVVFGVERPLILEIGFGYGQMLRYLHEKHPDHNIVGVEISHFCIEKVEAAITRDVMANVRVVRSPAETALHHLFTPESLSQLHINFPDPWFKDRHAGRRLMQRDTLDAMVSRLQPGARLYLATDIIAYAEMSHELLVATPGLTNLLATPWVNTWEDRAETKYERKSREEGRERYYFAYERNTQPAPGIPVMEERPMPNIVFQTPMGLDDLLNGLTFEDSTIYADPENETYISYKNHFRSDRSLLYEVHVSEPTIEQRVAVLVVQRPDNPQEYTVRLSDLGQPRPTDGLHRAVGLIGERLVALHSDAKIIHNKVRT